MSSLRVRNIADFTKIRLLVPEIARAALSPGNARNVLFSTASNPTWERNLRWGFGFTHHRVTFADLTPDAIAANDLVVPLTISDLRRMNAQRDFFDRNPIPLPSNHALSLCDDKSLFAQAMEASGFRGFIPAGREPGEFPYVLKKPIDEYGMNSVIIWDKEAEDSLPPSHAAYVRQQLILGEREYCTHIIIRQQRIVCSLTVEYHFGTQAHIRGQHWKPLRWSLGQIPFLPLFEEILRTIGFEGICAINYKIVDGQPRIFEINPRFGGSLQRYFFTFMRHL